MVGEKTMKSINILVSLLLLSTGIHAQNPVKNKMSMPDVDQYKVLKCEFHIHTVFSDGNLWPTERILEAYSDDLDAIAITDHLEYRPHLDEFTNQDHNRAYTLAEPLAKKLNILNIHGTEITRMVPPGHLNALFIQDANPLFNPAKTAHPGDSAGYQQAVKLAVQQGGFVFFNHPYYQQKSTEITLPASVEQLMDEGFVKGIEIVNEDRYIAESFQWALDKNLTLLGTSDAHSSIGLFCKEFGLKHRPMTLVLAKERSQESIKEALQAGRTLVWWQDKILGKEELVKQLVQSYVRIKRYEIENNRINVVVENDTPLSFNIELLNSEDIYVSQAVELHPHSEIHVSLQIRKKDAKTIPATFRINNAWVADKTPLMLEYQFTNKVNQN